MAVVKPFGALRPKPELAARLCEPPYDVMSSDEARELAAGNPYSFLHVSKPEIDLPPGFRRTVIAPKSEKLTAPGGTAKITSTSHGAGHCVITDELENRPTVVSPQDYPAMLKAESALRQKSARVFLLEKE